MVYVKTNSFFAILRIQKRPCGDLSPVPLSPYPSPPHESDRATDVSQRKRTVHITPKVIRFRKRLLLCVNSVYGVLSIRTYQTGVPLMYGQFVFWLCPFKTNKNRKNRPTSCSAPVVLFKNVLTSRVCLFFFFPDRRRALNEQAQILGRRPERVGQGLEKSKNTLLPVVVYCSDGLRINAVSLRLTSTGFVCELQHRKTTRTYLVFISILSFSSESGLNTFAESVSGLCQQKKKQEKIFFSITSMLTLIIIYT